MVCVWPFCSVVNNPLPFPLDLFVSQVHSSHILRIIPTAISFISILQLFRGFSQFWGSVYIIGKHSKIRLVSEFPHMLTFVSSRNIITAPRIIWWCVHAWMHSVACITAEQDFTKWADIIILMKFRGPEFHLQAGSELIYLLHHNNIHI